MIEIIEKSLKTAKIFKIALLVCLALAIICIAAMIIPGFVILILVAFFGWIAYANMFSPLVRNNKWLNSRGYTNVAAEFTPDMPAYSKSKIVCGTNSLMMKKNYVVIPYAEIAWMYVEVRRVYGIIPVGRNILVFTRDGKNFMTKGNVDELKAMLTEHILRANPNVIVGFGAEQQKKYKQVKASFKA